MSPLCSEPCEIFSHLVYDVIYFILLLFIFFTKVNKCMMSSRFKKSYILYVFQISLKERPKKVRALVDCRAVDANQLAFFKDEVIIVTATDDQHWWVSIQTLSH